MPSRKPVTRIVFLDVDGVLNSASSGPNPHVFGQDNVAALNRIIERTGALIVVSSVWRLGKSSVRLQCILNEQGVKGTVIDRTSRLFERIKRPDAPERPDGLYVLLDWDTKSAQRGDEIQEWLSDYKALHPGEKVVFVILDDDSDMSHLRDRLVQTDEKTGLTNEDADKAILMLKEVTW